ncbi:MAG TPA: cupin domain-containing protein [Acidimicrobiia bacterium]
MTDPIAHAQEVRREHPAPEAGLLLTWVRHTERSSTGVVDISPGGGLKPHIHETHDEIVTILEGSVEFRLGDDTFDATAGDVIPVPAGTVHAPVHSAEGCLMISVFAPWFDPENPDRVFIN